MTSEHLAESLWGETVLLTYPWQAGVTGFGQLKVYILCHRFPCGLIFLCFHSL